MSIVKTASQSENVITQVAQVKANSSLPEITNYSNYPVPNSGGSGSGEILTIIMGMTIFGCMVKKLMS